MVDGMFPTQGDQVDHLGHIPPTKVINIPSVAQGSNLIPLSDQETHLAPPQWKVEQMSWARVLGEMGKTMKIKNEEMLGSIHGDTECP